MSVQINEEALADLKKQLTPMNTFKVIFGTLVSLGATAAVIMAFKDPIKGAKGLMKLLIGAGVLIIGDKVGDIAEEHFKDTVDKWSGTIKDIQDEMNKEKGDDAQHGEHTDDGRDSKQQPEKQGDANSQPEDNRKAPAAPVWRRWRGEKKGTE